MLEETAAPGAAMDAIYRSQRHIYDVTRRYFLLGRDQMLDGLTIPENGTVLEIGCGTGRNLIGAARRSPNSKLYGIDISDEMLKSAVTSLMKHNLHSRVQLACADATNFSAQKVFGVAKFDRVYFSYTISMIPNWQAALDQALACVATGGQLHIVDFGQCAQLPPLFKRGLFSWLKVFHVHPREDLVEHLKIAAKARGMTVTFKSKFRDYAWLVTVAK